MKPLDMADTYDPLSYQDDYNDPDSEPTVKIQMSAVHPKFIVDEDADEDEPTLPSMRNPFYREREKTYPGIGLLIAITFSVAVWFLPAYYVAVNYIFR